MAGQDYFKFSPLAHIGKGDSELVETAKVDASKGKDVPSVGLPAPLAMLGEDYSNHHKKELERGQQEFHAQQLKADEGVKGSDPSLLDLNRIKEKAPEFFQFDFNGAETKVDHANELLLKQNNALKVYMNFNGLNALPTRADMVPWKIALPIFILFFVEALINAGLFMGTKGLLGALTLTTAQAFINITTSFAAGLTVVGAVFYHRRLSIKIITGLIFALHLFFITWLNMALGLWRGLMDQYVATGAFNIFKNPEVLNQCLWPFDHLDEFNVDGVLIVLTGLVFAMLSYFKGYFSDDPHPGFGRLYRSVKKAYDDVIKVTDDLKGRWLDATKHILGILLEEKKRADEAARSWSESVNLIEKIEVDWTNIFGNANEDFRSKIDLYFTAYNSVSAVNKPTPDYTLFKDAEIKTDIIFSDVSDYFLSDNARIERGKAMRESILEQYNKTDAAISEETRKGSEIIQKITKEYPSISIGGGARP